MDPVLSLLLFLLMPNGSLGFKFTIVHNNDMHARYDPMKGRSEECVKGEDEQGLCFGGFARVAAAVAKAKSDGPTIFLNAGDTFQGTTWYTYYKGELAADLMNLLRVDAMSLGNHEFDDNVAGLVPFLKRVKFPVVCCNLDVRKVPQMQGLKNLVRSTVITRLGTKIGVIGYLTPETKHLVATNEVEYEDEIPSINAEAEWLTSQGVNIIIALGHSGYNMDKEIAKNCPLVDVVVGGHSHFFLYTGKPPSTDMPQGNYPTVVTQPNGRQVPVVQAYAYTKYLGKITLEFDNKGYLLRFGGTPILLDSSVEADAPVKSLLDAKRAPIDELAEQIIGITTVLLDGDRMSCRKRECNFGNLIADAMVYGRVGERIQGENWTDTSIALINAGGIRASIDASAIGGAITGQDILTALPFGNQMSITRVKGKSLVKAFEQAATLRATWSDGGFFQVSGIRLTINYNHPKGQRVTSLHILCTECTIPQFEPINSEKEYRVIIPTFILNGGDGYFVFNNQRNSTMQLIDRDLIAQYLQEHKIVYPMLEDRITIVLKKPKSDASIPSVPISSLLAFIALTILYIFY